MPTVTSADGTPIGYDAHGDGPPLVLLHGSSATRESWTEVVPHLEDDFTVVVPDRRGRGASGDGDEYHLQREVDDLRAVVDAVDGPLSIVGHSYGGLVALAAAPELAVERLALYEPAILVGRHRDATLHDEVSSLLDDGDRRGVMRRFLATAVDDSDVDAIPGWPADVDVDLAETVVREVGEVEAYRLPAEPRVDAPTLLLVGERGPSHLRDAARTVEERHPDSRLVELEEVGHLANATAPDRLAAEIRAFCGPPPGD